MSTLKDRFKVVKRRCEVKVEGVATFHNLSMILMKGEPFYFLDELTLYNALKNGPGAVGEHLIGSYGNSLRATQGMARTVADMPQASLVSLQSVLVTCNNEITGVKGTIRQDYLRYYYVDHDGVVQKDDRNIYLIFQISVDGHPDYPADLVRYAHTFKQAQDVLAYLCFGTVNPDEEFVEDKEYHEGDPLEEVLEFVQGQLY